MSLQMRHEPIQICANGFCKINYTMIGFVWEKIILITILMKYKREYYVFQIIQNCLLNLVIIVQFSERKNTTTADDVILEI